MIQLIGSHKIHLKETDSTNDYASKILMESSPEEGSIITTDFQKKGKGQRLNKWESMRGENILLSIILYPDFMAIEEQFLISKFVSLAIVDFLNSYINNLSIKWPNDIYYKNKKIAGILIENMIQGNKISHTIIGIGINVNQLEFSEKLVNPTSLKLVNGESYKIDDLIKDLCMFLNNRYKQLKQNKTNELNNDYLSHLYLLNKKHIYKTQGESFEGRIIGVSKIGKLQVKKSNNEIQEFGFKEVEF